jgi:Family of unknown function (DUF6714)
MTPDQQKLMERVSLLLERIAVAFADVLRPAITHSVARGYDDEWTLTPERGRELAARDPEHSWDEVSDRAIENFQEYFSFSDAEGWRFYLPAHMSYYLRHFPRCGYYAVYDACVSRRYFDLLTPEQVACVDEFLALVHAGDLQTGDPDGYRPPTHRTRSERHLFGKPMEARPRAYPLQPALTHIESNCHFRWEEFVANPAPNFGMHLDGSPSRLAWSAMNPAEVSSSKY